jgi:hypothetical protein
MLVVLAMHIVGDRAAERDELRAGQDRREPAGRHRDAQQPLQRQAGLGAENSALAVEQDDAIELVGDQQPPVLVQADVAIGAAHPEAEERLIARARRAARLVEKRRPGDAMRHAAQPTP